MIRRLAALGAACTLLACGQVWAAMRDAVPGSDNGTAPAAPSASSSWKWRDVPLDFLAGASIFKDETGIALAVRGPLVKEFRWEVGGVLPHQVADYAGDGAITAVPPFTEVDRVRVRTFGETHAVALYPLLSIPRSTGRPGITVDAGAGISIGIVNDEMDKQNSSGIVPFGNGQRSLKPLLSARLQLGVAAAVTDRWSVRLDAAWVDYANRESIGVTNFNLNFSGILINPMLQVRL